MVILCGCSHTVYSHQKVMQSLHTKNDVLSRFGAPTKKTSIGDLEQWTYYMDTLSVTDKPTDPDTLQNAADTTELPNSGLYIDRHKYVKFLFDTAGNVAGYKSNGVDLKTVKKDNFGKSTVKGLEVAGILILLIGYEVAKAYYDDL